MKERCCSGVHWFCWLIIGIYGSLCNTSAELGVFGAWYGASAIFAARVNNDKATIRTAGGAVDDVTGETNCKASNWAVSRAVSGAVNRATGETTCGAACRQTGRSTCKTAGRVAVGAVGRAVGGATGETNHWAGGTDISRSAGRAARKVAGRGVIKAFGQATGKTNHGTPGEDMGKSICKAAGGAIGRATDGALDRAIGKTNRGVARGVIAEGAGRAAGGAAGKVWTDVIIILTYSLVYTPKFEKQNRQPKNSSFYSYLTNVIWNATFASRWLQVIVNLRLTSPLFCQVCSTKLFKFFSYTQVCLAAIFGLFGGFSASNFWRSPESQRSEYFVVPAYIIRSFTVIS